MGLGLPNVIVDESIHGWRVIIRSAIEPKEPCFMSANSSPERVLEWSRCLERLSYRSYSDATHRPARVRVAFNPDKAVGIWVVDLELAE